MPLCLIAPSRDPHRNVAAYASLRSLFHPLPNFLVSQACGKDSTGTECTGQKVRRCRVDEE